MNVPRMEGQSRRRWMFWLRLTAGVALVAFLAARTDWRPVATALSKMRLGVLACRAGDLSGVTSRKRLAMGRAGAAARL